MSEWNDPKLEIIRPLHWIERRNLKKFNAKFNNALGGRSLDDQCQAYTMRPDHNHQKVFFNHNILNRIDDDCAAAAACQNH